MLLKKKQINSQPDLLSVKPVTGSHRNKLLKMKTVTILVLFLAFPLLTRAQKGETLRVSSESSKAVPNEYKYLYKQFAPGVVYYRNGTNPTARMNYNLLLREMQFLHFSGDTLTLDQEAMIRRISLNGDEFIYDLKKGFLKIVENYGNVKLGLDHSIQVAGVDKEGGYGQTSGVYSIKTINTFSSSNSSIAKLDIKGDVIYSQQKIYYLVDQNGLVFPVSKKRILKLFSRHRSEILDYLEENPVKFNELDEVRRLLNFCKDLP